MAETELDTHGIPHARAIQLHRCESPTCHCPHLVLFDDGLKPIAIAILSRESVDELKQWKWNDH